VPQYLSDAPVYRDTRDPLTRLFVESAQHAPRGPIFIDAQPGGQFSPDAPVDRLTAAVALVRAAGLQEEAESSAGTLLNLWDLSSVAPALRGYAQVAVSRGLLAADGTSFRPQARLTRAELAHAMTTLARIATE
ncbi:MAG: S-layer homology domain-containing protein, partial [Pyrinomonadaceae bacterium]